MRGAETAALREAVPESTGIPAEIGAERSNAGLNARGASSEGDVDESESPGRAAGEIGEDRADDDLKIDGCRGLLQVLCAGANPVAPCWSNDPYSS